MLVFEKLSQALAASYKWDIGIAGTYLRLSACQWPVTVMIEKGGRVIGQMTNMLAGDYVQDVEFDAVTVLNGSTAQIVELQIAGGGAGSNRVLGEVSVINGSAIRAKAGSAFWQSKAMQATAGNYPHVQIWNPVGSGRVCIVDDIGYSVLPSSGAHLIASSAPLATFAMNPASKLAGGVGSVMEIRVQEAAALIGAPFTSIGALSGDMKVLNLSSPYVIYPGKGLILAGSAAAQMVQANFQFYEEPI